MIKRKEIIIVVLVIMVTVFLAFLPTITSSMKSNGSANATETKSESIEITITGELTKDNIKMTVPYGTTYGYIINKILPYLNGYSIVDSDKKKRYYENTVITIKSSDVGAKDEYKETTDTSNLININTASEDTLTTLYGIGTKRAKAIVEYRETIGKISTFEELRDLLGVSDEVIKAIREKACL